MVTQGEGWLDRQGKSRYCGEGLKRLAVWKLSEACLKYKGVRVYGGYL